MSISTNTVGCWPRSGYRVLERLQRVWIDIADHAATQADAGVVTWLAKFGGALNLIVIVYLHLWVKEGV